MSGSGSSLAKKVNTFASGRCPHCQTSLEDDECPGCGQEFLIEPPEGGEQRAE